ncbi:hypothetical protein [Alteribacter keqinensis]|uniref:Uncharacterized protein n=1 Tax=Alteribacter keqinensis TaxID=2483800 RepID=A0A3M7TTZ4_9BACI|nr:hypothetical protein [Alteribacter keqinensis]RNA68997.1 hypothetical protein EBO34_03290 [Alteribacter keqinensis]
MASYLWKPILILIFYSVTRRMFINNKWTVPNVRQKNVPYNFGMVFLLWVTLEIVQPGLTSINMPDYCFLFATWMIGWVDDRFGKAYPKGIKGHVQYCFMNRTVTTGLIKAGGGAVIAGLYLSMLYRGESITQLEALFYLPLVTLLPHVVNLLDTRPLRVMKAATLMIMAVIVVSAGFPQISGLGILLLLWAREEAGEKTMLGDNGAMLVGAYLTIAIMHTGSDGFVFISTMVCGCLTLIAEKYSISKLIMNTRMLSVIDLFGQKRSTS